MRAVIIGGGSIEDYGYIKSKISGYDYVICADGGYNHALRLELTPDILLGDFDSIEKIPENVKKIEYPARKDFTDGEIAVKYAVEHGFDDIVLIAMSGDRTDHTITDILLMTQCKNAVMIDDNNEIRILRDSVFIDGKKGDTVSIIPISGDLAGVTTSGLEYPLKDETLYFGESRGVSNVMLGERAEIKVQSGIGLVIKVRNI